MTYKNYKFAMFTALVLSMIIPVTGINIANATQDNKVDVGKVADGTYDEDLAFQRIKDLYNVYMEKAQQKSELEQKLSTKEKLYAESLKNSNLVEASSLLVEIETIKNQKNVLQKILDDAVLEYNQIQEENVKLYHIEPSTYEKFVSAQNSLVEDILKQYSVGQSAENGKKLFPLVEIGINHKKKAIEIVLFKGISDSEKEQFVSVLDKMISKDIPWFVSYGDYLKPLACTSRTAPNSCNPMIGGIQIQANGHGSCTLGIKATRSGLVGFVTAGHCVDGNAFGSDVFQPAIIGGTNVGSLQIETLSNNTPCDCAFVADRPTSPSMGNGIYQASGFSFSPITATSSAGQAGHSVAKSGAASSNTFGTVTNTNTWATITVNGATYTVVNLVKSTLPSKCGDSGAPATSGIGSGTSFYGIVVIAEGVDCNTLSSASYHSPYEQITAQLNASIALG